MKQITSCLWCGSTTLDEVAKRKDGAGVLKCKDCGLFMVSEYPEELGEYYDEDDYFKSKSNFIEEIGYHKDYDLTSPIFLYWQTCLLSPLITPEQEERFLEIGCATGTLMEILKARFPKLILKGIDISKFAVDTCLSKGLDVEKVTIEKFRDRRRFDLIFSSETMEHVGDLRSYIEGIKANLKKDGIFVFYIPSVIEKEIKTLGDKYGTFNKNFEHTLYLTPEFLKKEFEAFFKSKTDIYEFNSEDGSCIVGLVSADNNRLKKARTIISLLIEKDNEKETLTDADDLRNAAVLAAKFGNFELSKNLLANIKEDAAGLKTNSFFRGIVNYHAGELYRARENFIRSFENRQPGIHELKILYLIEKEINDYLEKVSAKDSATFEAEITKLKTEIARKNLELSSKNLELSNKNQELIDKDLELGYLHNSHIVGPVIRFRDALRFLINNAKNSKKAMRAVGKKVLPQSARRSLKKLTVGDWRVKKIPVVNEKWSLGPLISIITPFYDRGDTINETVKSVLSQTFQDFEYIIVDDGSQHKKNIEALSSINHPKITILRQENRGTAAARNTGIKRAKGKYILCLDSDDTIEPTYLEKALLLLETNPDISLVTTHMQMFGTDDRVYHNGEYDPWRLFGEENMVTTAAIYKKEAWDAAGGYKNIRYEDWEFWISCAEKEFWGKLIPETLLNYRTAEVSKYTEDKQRHTETVEEIKNLHPDYFNNLNRIHKARRFKKQVVIPTTAFINLDKADGYLARHNTKKILIAIPWMTFGGAETLIYNYCSKIKDDFDISFVTGLESKHEWEYKFKEITPNIYHLANLFDNRSLYLEFFANYIKTRNIDVLHIIHNNFVFEFLPELRKRFPKLKIIVTLFNDFADHFRMALEYGEYIDVFTSDNNRVINSLKEKLPGAKSKFYVFPNAADCYGIFNPELFDRGEQRKDLNIDEDELAVFFIGRLSAEKKPDTFLEVAENILKKEKNIKFFIIGDGPMKDAVLKRIDEINNPNLLYLGYQSQIPKFLSAADVFVLPSIVEGFPSSIVEAMAMKVGIIASDVGAISEVIKDGEEGFVVQPASVEEISQRVLELTKDRGLLAIITENARRSVEKKYSTIILCNNYKKLYAEE